MSLISEIINYYKLPSKVRANLPKYTNAHRIVGDLDLYVSITGDDTNDGLAPVVDPPTGNAPFATIQRAIDEVKTFIIDSDAIVNINVGAGVYPLTESIVADIDQGDNVSIIGVAPIETTLLNIDTVANTVSDWRKDITIEVGSIIGMKEGDHLMITDCDVAYTLGQAEMNGTWEIIGFPSGNLVTISFDHYYYHWTNDTPETGYSSINPPAIGSTSVDSRVRVLKTRIVGIDNFSCIQVNGNKITLNNLSIEHDIDLLNTNTHGILARGGAKIILGENISVRKCYRAINSHSGSEVYVADGVVTSTNVLGFAANVDAIFYLSGETYASNNKYGYYLTIASTMSCGGRPRAYNNESGISVFDGSTIYSETGITARFGYTGLKVQRNASARLGTASRFGYNVIGIDCQINSSITSGTGLGSTNNTTLGVRAGQSSYIYMVDPSTVDSYNPFPDTVDTSGGGNYIKIS